MTPGSTLKFTRMRLRITPWRTGSRIVALSRCSENRPVSDRNHATRSSQTSSPFSSGMGGPPAMRTNAALAGAACSQIVGPQPGAFGYPCQHARSDFLILVKGKDEIGPARPGQRAMGTGLPLYRPPNPQEGRQHPSSTGAQPCAHAAANEMLRS